MSSSDLAVSVRGLSKAYTIAHNDERHVTLAEQMLSRVRNPFKRATTETFWALRDLDFDIRKGDVVGIIGRNGAGKSTLLKILSRITEPTAGEIRLYGRVGSLLEVGTGFHPELTGRENIYLNGQILGMRRREIDGHFDAIVDFAGIEQFLDTPVKRYSSGMYVRLAFAVAAHLSPDILIVDEVLAVGDAEFQQKCLGKMKDVATSGRTVLFVSHSMQAVTALCNCGIVLRNGGVEYQGNVSEATGRYLRLIETNSAEGHQPAERRPGTGEIRFQEVTPTKSYYDPTDEKVVRFRLKRRQKTIGQLYVSALLVNSMGVSVAQFDSRLTGYWIPDGDVIEGELRFSQPWPRPGSYHMDFYVCSTSAIVDRFESACQFRISDVLPFEYCASPDAYEQGLALSDFKWTSESRTPSTLGAKVAV